MKRLILLMYCPDKKGIIAVVTNFIHQRNGNIVYIDQYVDRIQGAFFSRQPKTLLIVIIDCFTRYATIWLPNFAFICPSLTVSASGVTFSLLILVRTGENYKQRLASSSCTVSALVDAD